MGLRQIAVGLVWFGVLSLRCGEVGRSSVENGIRGRRRRRRRPRHGRSLHRLERSYIKVEVVELLAVDRGRR